MPPSNALPPASNPQARSANDERLWACVSHFGGLLGFLPSLLVYLTLRDRSPLIRQESKEALNWQITFTMGYLVLLVIAGILSAVLALASLGDAAPALTALPLLSYIANVVFSITGGLRVNAGGAFRYPFSVRLIR